MGRKGNYADRPVKGPGRKAKKQPEPFGGKILGKSRFNYNARILSLDLG